MRKKEEYPRRFPADRKKMEVKRVIIAVEKKEIPPRLAPIPMPILLQEREIPSKIVAFRESGSLTEASFGGDKSPRR